MIYHPIKSSRLSVLLVNVHWFVKKNEDLSIFAHFFACRQKNEQNAKIPHFFYKSVNIYFFSQKSEH